MMQIQGLPTGPKPPPEDTYSGCLTRSNRSTCCTGVWLVDSLHGSDRTWNTFLFFIPNIIQLWRQLVWHQESPKGSLTPASPYLLEEGRVFSEVFGDHIKTEEVTVDASSRHRQAVHALVLFSCLFQQPQTLFCLMRDEIWERQRTPKCEVALWVDGVTLTVSSLIMERTKAQDSMVQERTVSVRPSRNKRVMEASYVRQNFPLSLWESKKITVQYTVCFVLKGRRCKRKILNNSSMIPMSGIYTPCNGPVARRSGWRHRGWSGTSLSCLFQTQRREWCGNQHHQPSSGRLWGSSEWLADTKGRDQICQFFLNNIIMRII